MRITLILDPGLGLVAWVHYAPPLSDSLRKTYRQLLRWNDELPFAKFALSEDERPVLTAEVSAHGLDRDSLGLTVARLLAICDLLYEESTAWVDRISRPKDAPPDDATNVPDESGRALLERYAAELGELAHPAEAEDTAGG